MPFAQQWKTAKDVFLRDTGRKKPSDKFLGVFRKSAGIENACKGLDNALKEFNVKGMTKAVGVFEQAKDAYLTTLDRAQANEDENYQQQVTVLRGALERVAVDFADEWNKLSKREFGKLEKAITTSKEQLLRIRKQLQVKLEQAESQLQEADASWRAVAAGVAISDTKAAKKAAGDLQKKVKDLLHTTKELGKTYRDKLKDIDDALKDWEKYPDVINVSADKYDRLVGEIERFQKPFIEEERNRVEAIAAEAKTLLTKASKALKEGIGDAEAEYSSSIKKFSERARRLAEQCSNDVLEIENAYATVNTRFTQQFTPMEPGEDKEKLRAGLQSSLSSFLKEIQQVAVRLGKAKQTLKKEWKSFLDYFKAFAEEEDTQRVEAVGETLDEQVKNAVEVTKRIKVLQGRLAE